MLDETRETIAMLLDYILLKYRLYIEYIVIFIFRKKVACYEYNFKYIL